MKDDVNKRLCELLDAEPKELTQSRDEWERLTLKAKAGFEGLLADVRKMVKRNDRP